MNVALEKNFPLQSGADSAWTLLRDIESVANCMPGAEITELVDDENFKGKVRVRLGPVQMEFNGDINVQSIDSENQKIQLMATGKDKKGTSTVSMDLTANIEPGDGSNSALLGDAKVIVDGKLAGFGQRMMAQVSDQILDQFADNFRAKLGASESIEVNSDVTTDSALAQEESASSPNTVSEKESPGNEINGFKFALTALIGLVTGFFKRK